MRPACRASLLLVDEPHGKALRRLMTTARVRKGTGLILAANGTNYDPHSGCAVSSFNPPKGPKALLLCVLDAEGKVTHDFRDDPYLKKLIATLPPKKLRLTPRPDKLAGGRSYRPSS